VRGSPIWFTFSRDRLDLQAGQVRTELAEHILDVTAIDQQRVFNPIPGRLNVEDDPRATSP
jgi:hypothetical protein